MALTTTGRTPSCSSHEPRTANPCTTFAAKAERVVLGDEARLGLATAASGLLPGGPPVLLTGSVGADTLARLPALLCC